MRIDRITASFHQTVRNDLPPAMQELADTAAHIVQERITRVDFPNGHAAHDTLRLDLVLAAALRVR